MSETAIELFDDVSNRVCLCCLCQDLQQKVVRNGLDEIGRYNGMMCGNIVDMRMKYYSLKGEQL